MDEQQEGLQFYRATILVHAPREGVQTILFL